MALPPPQILGPAVQATARSFQAQNQEAQLHSQRPDVHRSPDQGSRSINFQQALARMPAQVTAQSSAPAPCGETGRQAMCNLAKPMAA